MTSTRLGLALVVAMTASTAARADLASGRDKLIAGDYKTAIADLGKVTGKDRPQARILLARAQLATGDHAGAEATLTPLTQGPAKDAQAIEAHLVFDQLRRVTGRLKDARADLEQNFKATLQAGLAKLDLVTREEFDAQRAVLLRTRQKVEELERAVAALEAPRDDRPAN